MSVIATTFDRWRSQTARALGMAGAITILAGKTIKTAFRHPSAFKDVFAQLEAIGIRSMAVVVLTAVFSSMVMTVQFAVQLGRFGAKEYVGNVVSLSLVRELGPVLTALMVGGRVGAGITAEIGSMQVTEQIDAMRSMCADPVRKLVLPRVVAGAISLPLLTVFANALGVTAAMLVATTDTDTRFTYFYHQIIRAVTVDDLIGGLLKTVFFGFMITLIACERGLATRGGTEGVGRFTTQTVVVTSITTLISDFVLTKILLTFGF